MTPSLLVAANRRLGFCHKGCTNGVFVTPSRSQSIRDKVPLNAKAFGNLNGWNATNHYRIALVPGLLFRCRPSAIVWLIVPINFFSVKAKPGWFVPHIGQKILENAPAFADRNAAPPVMNKAWNIRVKASGHHPSPCSRCRAGFVSNVVPVLWSLFANLVSSNPRAPAGNAPPISKVPRLSKRLAAAVANTPPDNPIAGSPVGWVGGYKASKPPPSEICGFHLTQPFAIGIM